MSKSKQKSNKQALIFEIFKACRLCGAGGGYRMPIIPNIAGNADNVDGELQQKIRDCVQIEVHQNDKMPPLICELCVDKINDYYEFSQMCKETNARTRHRLGLPPQILPEDCILGVTEPVFVNEDSDNEMLSRSRSKAGPSRGSSKVTSKRSRSPPPPVARRSSKQDEKRPSRSSIRKRSQSPPPAKRSSRSSLVIDVDSDDNTPVKKSKVKETPPSKSSRTSKSPAVKESPRSCLKSKQPEKSSDRKRDRSKDQEESKSKKVRISTPEQKKKPAPPPVASPPPVPCDICKQKFARTSNLKTHQTSAHTVTFTPDKQACNACGEWFASLSDAQTHHRNHKSKKKPYSCKKCNKKYNSQDEYDDHIEEAECVKVEEVPDIKCDECWLEFATQPLYDDHDCLGEDGRPGGKCAKCSRKFMKYKTLLNHEKSCTKLPKHEEKEEDERSLKEKFDDVKEKSFELIREVMKAFKKDLDKAYIG